MSNPFAYAELHTTNPDQAKQFYRQLFDWRTKDAATPAGTYTEIEIGEGIAAGMLRTQATGVPSHWLPYVKVGDLAASTKKAKDLGAQAIVELQAVPEAGTFSVLTDPTGAPFGLWEPTAKK